VIHVIATVELQPGSRESFLAVFRQLVPRVLQEQGCLAYGPTIDLPTIIAAQGAPRADTVTVVEQWESIEHLEAHLHAPHMLTYREQVKPWVKQVSLQILQPV
jgi:quinol monooxygenase YgiN